MKVKLALEELKLLRRMVEDQDLLARTVREDRCEALSLAIHAIEVNEKFRELLAICREDIDQAIYTEEGLDGGRGQETIKMIDDFLAQAEREKP